MEMTNRQYFCIRYDPTIVNISIEWSDVLFSGAEKPASGDLRNVVYGQNYGFPVIKTNNDGFIWIAMAGTRPDGGLVKFESGKVIISICAKVNDLDDAEMKFSVSIDSRTLGKVETLRHDRIKFVIDGEKVDIGFSMSKPIARLEKKPAEKTADNSAEDILRNLRSDLRILEFYRSHDADDSVYSTLKAAVSAIEAGQPADEKAVYAAEAKIADFLSFNTELVRRYKSRIG